MSELAWFACSVLTAFYVIELAVGALLIIAAVRGRLERLSTCST